MAVEALPKRVPKETGFAPGADKPSLIDRPAIQPNDVAKKLNDISLYAGFKAIKNMIREGDGSVQAYTGTTADALPGRVPGENPQILQPRDVVVLPTITESRREAALQTQPTEQSPVTKRHKIREIWSALTHRSRDIGPIRSLRPAQAAGLPQELKEEPDRREPTTAQRTTENGVQSPTTHKIDDSGIIAQLRTLDKLRLEGKLSKEEYGKRTDTAVREDIY